MAKKNKFKQTVYGKKEQQAADRKQDKTPNKLTAESSSDQSKKENPQHTDKQDKPRSKTPVLQQPDKSSPHFQLKKKPGKGLDDRKLRVNDDSVRKKRVTDPKLIPRMREYLESRTNKSIVSIPLMAEYLQKKHMEYPRRKRGVFTKYIEKAYAIMDGQSQSRPSSSADEVSDSEGEGDEQNESGEPRVKRRKMLKYDDDADSFVEEEVLMEYKDTNAINSMMSNLYKSSPQPSPGPVIDIPSADSNSNGETQNNGSEEPNNPRKNNPDGVYFIDKKGDSSTSSVGGARNSREETIERFMGGLPSRSSAVNNGVKDPRLFRINTGSKKRVGKAPHGGITLDNTGVSLDPPSSPTPEVQNVVEEIVIESDTEELPSKKGSKDGAAAASKDTPRRDKKSKAPSKTKKGKEGMTNTDKKDGPALQMSNVTFADIGGNEQSLVEICKLLVHMRHPEVYQQLGVTPPRGFLLHGPPGCGKTLLANAIAGELELPLLKIAATEIVSGVSGDSEEKVRELFDMATRSAPCVLFIDEVDAITPKRETASKDMERRIVSQLLTCMDDLNKNTEAHVLVIGATNRPDSLDPALRRAGRFDKEICLGIPDEASRKRILEVLCRNLRLTPNFDFTYLAKFSPGYVGADLMSLTREAAMVAVNRVFKDLQSSTPCEKTSQTSDSVAATDSDKQMDTSEPSHTGSPQNTSSHPILHNGANSVSQPQNVTNGVKQPQNVTNGVNQSAAVSSGPSDVNQSDSAVKQTDTESVTTSDKELTSSTSGVLTQSNSESVVRDNQTNKDVVNTDLTKLSGERVTLDKSPAQADSNNTNKAVDHHISELCSVLSWLKDQPPLTEDQLRDLFVSLEDFKEALKTVQPSAKREGFATVPDVTWDDIGALHQVREELQLAILAPVRHAEEFKALGLNRAQGVLLAGPPGCGKTLLAKAVANESGINFISVKGPELLNMYVGESEKAVRTVFQRARNSSPCVIFFDELDALCPRRSGSADSGSSSRVVNQLLTEMDGLEERKQVFIMAATNRPDIIDPAVLRPGRLDKTLYVGLPTLTDRLDILNCLTKNGTKPLLSDDVNMGIVAGDQRCENYTGADLAALVREASVSALKEAISKLNRPAGDPIAVNKSHFETAFKKIKPSVSDKDRERYMTMGNKMSIE